MSRCAICKFPLQEGEETTTCPDCGSVYHAVCWESVGGCAVYGCSSVAPPDVKVQPAIVGQGWGDEKVCPNCSRALAASLIVCGCGARFPWAEPMTRDEYRTWLNAEQLRAEKRNWLIVFFLTSLFAFPAPFVGAISGYYAYRNRHDLSGEYGAFLALGYGTAAIGVIYTFILIAVYLG